MLENKVLTYKIRENTDGRDNSSLKKKGKGKAIHVKGREGPWGCEE
jgi:hypothetical protein